MLLVAKLKSIYSYRGFVLASVKREFESKYKRSLLGSFWAVANPLAMIAVYTLIFSEIMKARLPGVAGEFAYGIYVCAGVLTWGLFSEITLRGQNVFLDNANLIKKLSFPKICLPIITTLSSLLNFAIIFILFTLFLIISSNFPGFVFLYVFLLLAILVVFAASLGVILGVLNVFFRDVGQFFGIFLQFWFWLTPIVYPKEIIPQGAVFLLQINPMAAVIEGFQRVLVFKEAPNISSLIYPLAVSALLLIFAFRLFRAKSLEMADEI